MARKMAPKYRKIPQTEAKYNPGKSSKRGKTNNFRSLIFNIAARNKLRFRGTEVPQRDLMAACGLKLHLTCRKQQSDFRLRLTFPGLGLKMTQLCLGGKNKQKKIHDVKSLFIR